MRPLLSGLTLLILTAPLAPSQGMDGGVTPTVEALAKFLEARGEQVARGAQLFDSACSTATATRPWDSQRPSSPSPLRSDSASSATAPLTLHRWRPRS